MKFSTFTRTALAGVAALMICGSAAADTWRVATEGTFPPFEFYNSQTGEVQGFEVDLVKAMAQKMGKDLKLETLGFDAIIPGILSGTIDTGAAGFSITPERGKRVLFSIPFYKSGLTIVVPKGSTGIADFKDLEGKRISVQLGTTSMSYAKQIKGAKMNLDSKYHDGAVWVDQGEIAGCAGGTFDNICAAADILRGKSCGNGAFTLSIYPGSMPALAELIRNGRASDLVDAGAIMRECFCGPCFGAGDVPANGALSIRHTTRNFPSREGSKPGSGQLAGVALMDARSIAATTANGGILTPATDIDYDPTVPEYQYDASSYDTRVYQGFGKGDYDALLKLGPNIKDWPEIAPLGDNLLLKVASYITDPVTTTDELIPSGETSSYRSNPLRLAEFTLSRRVPEYVPRAKDVAAREAQRRQGDVPASLLEVLGRVGDAQALAKNTQFGSCVFANKPGDGSAREQAASCQKVLGGFANICYEYATKRYRSNCINWGILPFTIDQGTPFDYQPGDCVFVPGIRAAIENGAEDIPAQVICRDGSTHDLLLHVRGLTQDEKEIILDGCLMNYYAARM